MRTVTYDEWHAEGRRRFGDDEAQWQFICPSCGHIAKAQDWIDLGAQSAIAYSCVGRWTPAPKRMFNRPGPCNYAGGGLFALNPVQVVDGDVVMHVFEFADVLPEEK
jgi:hypothetical protein